MGVTLPAFLPESYDAAFLARAASGVIRDYCGWHVAPSILEVITLDGPGGRTLLVPSMRIQAVRRVVSAGRDVTSEVKWGPRSGVMRLASGWSCDPGDITVELVHGFELDEVPSLAAIVVAIGQRASAGNAAVIHQAAGGMSMRFATTREGMAAGVPLFADEKASLNKYRLAGRT